jgi:hypothetical protein
MFKKLFYVIALVALLATASLPGGAASARGSADGVLIKGFANVTNIDLVSAKPVAFKLTGSIVCDQPAVTTLMVGNTIAVFALDIKVPGSSRPCGAPRSGSATVMIPNQVPSGIYTVLVNPNLDGSGAQKAFVITVP